MRPDQASFAFPRPGKAVIGMMVVTVGIWIIYAVSFNWAEWGEGPLGLLLGSTPHLFQGQIWRLVTAPFVHFTRGGAGVSHLLTTLMVLYFFGPSMEDRWGPRKLIVFMVGSAAFAFLLQAVVALFIPKLDGGITLGSGMRIGPGVWFGGLGMIEALSVAWALSSRGQTVRLFFLIPITGTMLLIFIFAMSVLNVLALTEKFEGLVTPFGGMLAGYLFGDASPLRRLWLKLRLKQIQRETAALRTQPRKRAAASGLRVIKGGVDDDDKPPKDKKYLN